MTHRYVPWVSAAAIILILGFAATFIYSRLLEKRAESLLHDVALLRVGISSDRDLAQIITRHQHEFVGKHCDSSQCEYSFEVANTALAFLRLEPAAQFTAVVSIKDGSVEEIRVRLNRDTRVFSTSPSGGAINEYREFPKIEGIDRKPFEFATPVGKPYLRIDMDRHATAEQRRRAYAFSFKCLTKLGSGCDLPCDYLPLVWNDWMVEVKAIGFDVDRYYPNVARCGR